MSVPFSRLKGAIVYKLSQFYEIPDAMQEYVAHLCRKDCVSDVPVYLLTQSQSFSCTPVARTRIKNFRQAMNVVVQGMDGEDEGALLENYQKITSRQFEPPEWLFEDNQALKRESATAIKMIR
jgi:hypothetical protein